MVLTVDELGADPERLDVLSLQLREELLATDAEDVARLRAGDAPPGTRGLDLVAAGGLVVTLASTLDSVSQIVETYAAGSAVVATVVGGPSRCPSGSTT